MELLKERQGKRSMATIPQGKNTIHSSKQIRQGVQVPQLSIFSAPQITSTFVEQVVKPEKKHAS